MSKKLPLLDTNVIIRYLANDIPQQAEKANQLFKQSPEKSLFLPDLIIAEITYVLLSFYQLPKSKVVEKINILLDFEKFKTNKRIMKKTLEIFSEYNISFTDAYLLALNILKKHPFIYSFDLSLAKIKVTTVKSP